MAGLVYRVVKRSGYCEHWGELAPTVLPANSMTFQIDYGKPLVLPIIDRQSPSPYPIAIIIIVLGISVGISIIPSRPRLSVVFAALWAVTCTFQP